MREVQAKLIATCLPLQKSGWPTGTGFIRGVQPLSHKHVSCQFRRGGLLDTPLADVLFVVRNAITNENDRAQLTRAQALRIPIVIDLDDALFEMAGHANQEAFRETLPALKRVLTIADEVWTTTDYLREKLIIYNNNVHAIQNALDEDLWKFTGINSFHVFSDDNVLRLLYMGSYTHCSDLLPMLNSLEPLFRSGKIEVTIVGGMQPDQVPKWVSILAPPPEAGLTYPSFVEWFIGLRGVFDLGLAPLEDNEFNRCKSSIKLLDYAGLGLPAICSDVGPYKADDFPAFRVSGSLRDWLELVDYLAGHRDAIIEKRLSAIAELCGRRTLERGARLRRERLDELSTATNRTQD